MKVTVNNTTPTQEVLQLPRLMIDKNGTIVLVKEKIAEEEYRAVFLNGSLLGTTANGFYLSNKDNPFTDFNGSITLSND